MAETLTEFAPADRAESERLVEQTRIFYGRRNVP